MTQTEVLTANIHKDLDCQTSLRDTIDAKGVSGPVSNLRPPDDPPDRKKRRPRSAGTEQGPNRKSNSSSQKENTKTASKSQEPERWLSVYAGRDRLASIKGTVGAFAVVMANGALLGRFDTLKQVSAAISDAQGGAR